MATNIRVINNKTGKPVTDVTPDNLKTFINNPQFSIDGSSLVPVDISGKQDLIPLNEYNPSTMKIRDGNYESNYQKYSSVGAQTQNISRQSTRRTYGMHPAVNMTHRKLLSNTNKELK